MSVELTEWEIKACKHVCGWVDDPVGECPTAVEIAEEIGFAPTDPRERSGTDLSLDKLVREGYLTRTPLRMIGNEDWRGENCYSPTDEARKLLPECYPPPIGVAVPWEVEHAAYEQWKATGEEGPCPLCGAVAGEMHGRKYCFGESCNTAGSSS